MEKNECKQYTMDAIKLNNYRIVTYKLFQSLYSNNYNK